MSLAPLEGYSSGRRGGFAKPVGVGNCARGFESLSLRCLLVVEKSEKRDAFKQRRVFRFVDANSGPCRVLDCRAYQLRDAAIRVFLRNSVFGLAVELLFAYNFAGSFAFMCP